MYNAFDSTYNAFDSTYNAFDSTYNAPLDSAHVYRTKVNNLKKQPKMLL